MEAYPSSVVALGEKFVRLILPKLLSSAFAAGPNNTLVTTCSDQTVRFWDPTTGMETSSPEVFASSVKLVLAGEESPFMRWSPLTVAYTCESGNRDTEQITRNRVLQHKSRISSACMSRDGSFIATACEDGSVHFWDTQHGERLGQPIQHASPISSLPYREMVRNYSRSLEIRTHMGGASTNPRIVPKP